MALHAGDQTNHVAGARTADTADEHTVSSAEQSVDTTDASEIANDTDSTPKDDSAIADAPESGRHASCDTGTPVAPTGASIVYPDASGLTRRREIGPDSRIIIGALAASALVIGGIAGYQYYDSIVNFPVHEAQAVKEQLARGTSLQIPTLTSFAGLDAEGITSALDAEGISVIDVNAFTSRSGNTIDLIKLPESMGAADAALAYARGVDSLSASDAVRLLMGSWRLTQQNLNTADLRVKYADFTAQTPDAAIDTAIELQGFAADEVSESGVDGKGNTYRSGSTTVDGQVFGWTISACPLSSAFNITGLPDDAQYVGVRVQKQ